MGHILRRIGQRVTDIFINQWYNDYVNGIKDSDVRSWLFRAAVRDEICAMPELRRRITVSQEIYDRMHARFVRKKDAASRMNFCVGDDVDAFVITKTFSDNIAVIAATLQDIARHKKRYCYIPPRFRELKKASFAELYEKSEKWSDYKARRDSRDHARLIRAFPGGYRLYACLTVEQAVAVGNPLAANSCLWRFARRMTRSQARTVQKYRNALPVEGLQFLVNTNGFLEAVIHLEDGVPQEIRGPENGGLLHNPALLLRGYFREKLDPAKFNRMSFDVARHIGLVKLNSNDTFVDYESMLPILCSRNDVNLMGLPVTQSELERHLSGKPYKILRLSGCANINRLTKGMQGNPDGSIQFYSGSSHGLAFSYHQIDSVNEEIATDRAVRMAKRPVPLLLAKSAAALAVAGI